MALVRRRREQHERTSAWNVPVKKVAVNTCACKCSRLPRWTAVAGQAISNATPQEDRALMSRAHTIADLPAGGAHPRFCGHSHIVEKHALRRPSVFAVPL